MQQDNQDNSIGIQVDAKDNSQVNLAINISKPPRGIPFQALALPKDYVDRPEIRQKIRSKLIDCAVSRPGTLVVSAIYGLGGVGKSVMAAALAHDAEVQKVCADGVLWVTLGQNPDLLSSLYDWVQKLGDYDFKPTNIDSASGHLRSLLHDKKMLLVVDDVWHTDHVVPFQVGGDGCRVLVTTREAEVLDADRIDMDVMSEEESLELLLSKAQVKTLTVEELQQAKKLIAVVGGLPLAVDLAGAQIADGVSWSELLEDLEAEIANLEALDRPNADGVKDEKNRKRLSLKASLNLSLKLLSSEQLQQFAWLGVLPEDVAIQSEMAATLWSIPRKKAGSVLRTFRAKALLLSGVQGVGQESSYRIHDLIHDLARGLLTSEGDADIPGLNLQWSDANGILLDRYRQQATDNLWHTLPDDSYIYSNLTWHMEKAARYNELHGLFQEVTTEGRNGWYERCDFLGLNAKFVTDLGRAWKLAEAMYGENAGESIALQIRYGLIFSTLNSLVSNIPAELMAALVKYKKWSPSQVLDYAKQSLESSKCIAILKESAVYLPPNLLFEAFDLVCGIQNESSRADALSALAAHLPENLLSDAFKLVCEMRNESSQVSALSGLVAYLPENLLSDAFKLVCEMQNESAQVSALSGLVAHLPENLLSDALNVAVNIRDESLLASVLSGLAAYLPKNLLLEALNAAHRILNISSRVYALIRIAAYLPDIVQDVLDLVRGMQNESSQAFYLTRIAAYQPDIISEAFDLVCRIKDDSSRASGLRDIVTYLPKNLLPKAFDLVSKIQDEYHQAFALSEIAACLSEVLLLDAFNLACGIQNDSYRSIALSGIAVYLPENLLSEVVDLAREFQDASDRTSVLSGVAANLPKNLLLETLDVARGIRDKYSWACALIRLVNHLPNISSEALNVAREIQDNSERAAALSELTVHLPNIVEEALDVAREIQSKSSKAFILSELAVHLPGIVPEVLDIVREIQSESSQANALNRLAAHLPQNLLSYVLDVAREIKDDSSRAYALSGFIIHRPDITSEILSAVRMIQDDHSRAFALRDIAIHLPKNLLSEAFMLVNEIQSESFWAYALSGFIIHQPEIAPKILSAVCRIHDDTSKAYVLSGIAAHLPKNLFSQVLFLVSEIRADSERAYILTEIATHLPENLLLMSLDMARKIQDDSYRADAFSGLVTQMDLKSINFPFWSEVLHSLSQRDRQDLLKDIPKLAPAIIHLSDRSTLNLVVQAMREVCQQWP
jgi:hypothetical protein